MSLSDRGIKLATVGITLCLLLFVTTLLKFTSVFPTHIRPFCKDDPSLNYPSVPETLSGPLLLLMCLVVPLLCLILPRLPSPPTDGFLYALPCFGNLLTLILTNVLKCMAGELRPSFLALCKLNESMEVVGNCANSTVSAVICTGEEAMDGRHSFPSSHCSQVCLLLILYQYME